MPDAPCGSTGFFTMLNKSISLLPKDQVSSVPKCSFFYQGFDLACILDEGRIEILDNLQHIGCNESYKSDLGQQALLNGEPVTVVSFHRFHFSCSLYFSINFFISFTKFSMSEILFFTIKYNSVSVTS